MTHHIHFTFKSKVIFFIYVVLLISDNLGHVCRPEFPETEEFVCLRVSTALCVSLSLSDN